MLYEYRRVQIYFSREAGALSHTELMQALVKAFDASGLPVLRPAGKTKLSLATALPLGMASRAEALEVQVQRAVTVREILEAIGPVLPPGIEAWGGEALYPGEKRTVTSIAYFVAEAGGGLPDEEELAAFFARPVIPVVRRKRVVDLKKILVDLERVEGGLSMEIAWSESGTARPSDVLSALGREPDEHPVVKTATTFTNSFGDQIRKPNDTEDPHQRPGPG